LHVMHSDQLAFPLEGNIRFQNLQEADHLLARPHLLTPANLQAMAEYRDALQRGCEASRVDYALFRTDRSLVQTLGEYLIRRMQAPQR